MNTQVCLLFSQQESESERETFVEKMQLQDNIHINVPQNNDVHLNDGVCQIHQRTHRQANETRLPNVVALVNLLDCIW